MTAQAPPGARRSRRFPAWSIAPRRAEALRPCHGARRPLVREFRRACLSKPVRVRTIGKHGSRPSHRPRPIRRDKLDDRTAADDDRPAAADDHGGLADRRRRQQAPRADQGRDQPRRRAARVRLFRWLLRLPLRDDARGRARRPRTRSSRRAGSRSTSTARASASSRGRRSTTSTRSWARASPSTTRTRSPPAAAARASGPPTTRVRRRAARTDRSNAAADRLTAIRPT